MDILSQDLRYAARWLLRNPSFTLISILALAIGIGANGAIFSVINALLLKPYQYEDLDRIVIIQESFPNQSLTSKAVSAADLIDWQNQNAFLQNIAAYKIRDITITGTSEPELVRGSFVSAEFFSIFKVKPIKGRTFLASEDQPGKDQVVVLSQGLWKRRFAADPNILNKTITLNSRSMSIIGVMPSEFDFPFATDLWQPLALTPQQKTDRTLRNLYAIAKLNPQTKLVQAQAEMRTLAKRIEDQFPDTNKGLSVEIIGLNDQQASFTKPMLSILMAMSSLLLLIACANVGNLLLARATARRKEIAIRASLSASRWRVVRQLLTESFLLSFIAGVFGLLLAFWCIDLIRYSVPTEIAKYLAGWNGIHLDLRVLVFTFAIAFLTTLLFGLVPSLQVTRLDLYEVLKEGGRGAAGNIQANRMRNLLIASEISLALVLLIGAGLMVNGFWRILNVYQVGEPKSVLTMRTPLPEFAYSDRQKQVEFYRQSIERLKLLPDLQSATVASNTPLNNSPNPAVEFVIEGRPPLQSGERQIADSVSIGPSYFNMVGAKLHNGRDFTETDNSEAPRVAIISELMAKQYWKNEDPVGKRIRFSNTEPAQWITIVGVASDLKQSWFDAKTRPQIFVPYMQAPRARMIFLVRAEVVSSDLISAARKKIFEVDPNQPVDEIKTLAQLYIDESSPLRFAAVLMLAFGALALILAGVGLYGVMSYSVAQRTREIGIRSVFGANKTDLLRLILGQGMKTTLLGLAIGLPLAFALSKVMVGALFGIVALEYRIFTAFVLLLTSIAFFSTYFPAHRATKVDAVSALHYE